ncbi:hypothetical protein ACPEIF_22625 [Streptomyces sp. NPDC012600]|uniref:hypothetical protein n=1 Tax=Streptomyces sp. NPDC012600 TaxID=3415005 RepID=UPI003C2F57F2
MVESGQGAVAGLRQDLGDDEGRVGTITVNRAVPEVLVSDHIGMPEADDQDAWRGHIDPRRTTATGDSHTEVELVES